MARTPRRRASRDKSRSPRQADRLRQYRAEYRRRWSPFYIAALAGLVLLGIVGVLFLLGSLSLPQDWTLLNGREQTATQFSPTAVSQTGEPRPKSSPTLSPTALVTDEPSPTLSPRPSPSPTPLLASTSSLPDRASLQTFMLDLINADRATEGLAPVEWDGFAAQAAQAHAEDMAEHGYMSHWNLAGEGPDIRYGRAGGTEWVQENVYMYLYRYSDGRPAPIEDWEAVIREAQASLMQSPGHRANIMAPLHTHVGLGIAYNAGTGDVRIAQEFINRYIKIVEPVPAQAKVGDVVEIRGQLLGQAQNLTINLAYEPFPQPMSVAEAEAVHTYRSPAEFFLALNPSSEAAGRFSAEVTLDYQELPGIYHVRIWVEEEGEVIQASDIIIEVTQ